MASTSSSATFTDREVPAIRIRGVGRRFGAVTALEDVSFDVAEGRTTALLGENGAGKSTLLKILAGLQPPSTGTVEVFGEVVGSYDPATMLKRYRVAIVPQELALAADRSVAQNIMMGVEPGGRVFPDLRRMEEDAVSLLARLGVELDPSVPVGRLNLATQQLVVVARSVARDCRVLILDEPTAMLTPAETERLFDLIGVLRENGVTIVYVSHRMPEVFALSDQIEVLRDGRHVASMRTADTDDASVVAAMVGRELGAVLRQRDASEHSVASAVPALALEALSGQHHTRVGLEVRPGEIVGIAGLPDSGRVELLRNVFGADAGDGGRVVLNGKAYEKRSPAESIRRGLAYVPGERKAQGLLASMSVAENIGVLSLDRHTRFGFVNKKALRDDAARRAEAIRVKTASPEVGIVTLSGGNQQKAILARWLSIEPIVLMLDEPTRGVDVGAKAEIYEQLLRLASNGMAILCSSSDLPELLAVCDRIAVMSEGRLVADLDAADASEESIMSHATGAVGLVNERTART